MTVFKYAMMRGLKNPTSMIVNCALPIILVITNAGVDFGTGFEHRSLFLIAMLIMFGAFVMARSIQLDKMEGTVIRILAGPVTMRSYLVQNFLSAMVPMAALSVAIGAIGIIVHSWEVAFAVALALCYSFLAASSIGLSFVWSCIFKDREASFAVMSVLLSAISMVSGLFLPLAILPDFFRMFGAIFPAHWAARGMEAFIAYGMNTEFWLSLLAMLLFTVAFLLYGGKRRIV